MTGQNIDGMHFIEKFDRENIDGQHLRPPALAILLETTEKENFDCQIHHYFALSKNLYGCYRLLLLYYVSFKLHKKSTNI